MPAAFSRSAVAQRLRLLASYMRGSTVAPCLPPTVIIATTHRCNMTCQMCIRAVRQFDGPNMEFSLFKKIIDEAESEIRYISLDGPGETTMNPDAFRMIRYAKGRGLRVMFSTNATLVDQAMTEEILDSGLDQIIFSVNGATPEVYRAVHGADVYEKAVANIRRFAARKCVRRAAIEVAVQMIRLPATLPEITTFYRQWQGIPGINSVRVKKDVVCTDHFSLKEVCRNSPRRNPCPRLWYGPVFIETTGDVYASPGVLYKADPIGNAARESLKELWNNERMRGIRRRHVERQELALPECNGCAYPRPRLPLIMAGFLMDPFLVGKLIPLAERLAFWHRLPLYERIPWKSLK